MNKYSATYMRNALLTIKFQKLPGAFVNYCHTNGELVAKVGTWFQVYAKTCIQPGSARSQTVGRLWWTEGCTWGRYRGGESRARENRAVPGAKLSGVFGRRKAVRGG